MANYEKRRREIMSKYYTHVARFGNKLLVRGYEDGVQFKDKVDFNPTLYIKSNAESKFKSLDGKSIKPLEFGSIKEAKEFIDRYEDVSDFEIYGNTNWQYQYLGSTWTKEIPWKVSDIRTYSIDIETTVENSLSIADMLKNPMEEILLITLQDKQTKVFTIFSARPFDVDFGDRKVNIVMCKDEKELLTRFLQFWNQQQIDVITGWNLKFFDIPYIVGRIERVFGNTEIVKTLSPWKLINSRDVEYQGKTITTYEIVGISVLDYLDLYKKYIKTPRESYKLGNIAYEELGTTKVKNPTDSFKDFYTNHFSLFTFYNVVDTELVDQLEEKLKLIELQITIAYFAKTNYEDIFGQVKVWETIIFNHLHKTNRIPGIKNNKAIKTAEFVGAYVKNPIVGRHKYVATMDLNSLYPHLIMMYNMSPETLVQDYSFYRNYCNIENLLHKEIDTSKAKELNYSLSANGVCYDNSVQGFLPELMENFYSARKEYKKKMLALKTEYEISPSIELDYEVQKYHNLQMAIKILINSCYGAIGAPSFKYYDLRMAEGITLSGQLSIRWIANKFNAFLNKHCETIDVDYILGIDTDSNFLHLETLVQKWTESQEVKGVSPTETDKINFMDLFCYKVLAPYIKKSYDELAEYMNSFKQTMNMDRDLLTDRCLIMAKKKYIMNVWDSEGVRYAEPKLKVVGLELVKSSTPEVIRHKLKDSVPILLYGNNDELRTFVSKFKDEFNSLSVETIAFPKGVNDIEKYVSENGLFGKGTPINVRASAIYNKLIKDNKLSDNYTPIQSGDKMKFIYLRTPNPIRQNVVGFNSELPKQFGLHDYVDYETMFEKVFLSSMEIMSKPLNWSLEPESSLKGFF